MKKVYEASGGKLLQFYLVMARYDVVVIGEAPNDKLALRVLYELRLSEH